MEPTITMHAIAHGRVQGVFFRATTRNHANSLNVKGTVRNLPDGTVEIWAQGTKQTLENLINKLENEPGMGEVSHFAIDYPELSEKFTTFDVIY